MEPKLVTEVMECLPKGRTHYRYFKGAYAPRLLSLLINGEVSVRALKQSRYKLLLNHPLVKQVAAGSGGGALTHEALSNAWQEPSQPFLLTLARWGGKRDRGWYQTSRFGENLVLQLNLPQSHCRLYKRYIDTDGNSTINGRDSMHPVQLPRSNPNYRDTLVWSRMDIDFETGEALIEEIQSDAVRNVADMRQLPKDCNCKSCRNKRVYINWFSRFNSIWSEAMLMATVSFLKEEMGINRIFYHTDRSGWQVKKMHEDWRAPRSLYVDLPKKFAFKRTWAAPEFLLNTKPYQQLIRKQPDIDFYQLDLPSLH